METYGQEMQLNQIQNPVKLVYALLLNKSYLLQTLIYYVFIVIFDPASFYGHHEYDIASTTLFGGYSKEFYDAYFKKIPKANGFENRMFLYHLFHYLNHWYDYNFHF